VTVRSRCRVVLMTPGRSSRAFRLTLGCAGLALLAGCAASGNRAAQGYSTNYYLSHAAANYKPPGPASDPWGPYINIAASRFDVPAAWIRQVMRVESGGNEYIDGQLTVSAAGAMGLMQLEPATYQEMAARYGLGADAFNPYDNIMAGAAYIHEMYQVYGSPGFLAAYNAGPGRLDSYMNYHTPLPNETINYVAMIAPNIQGYYPAHRSEADQLALNTQPASEVPGILPPGFVPEAPGPEAPDNPIAPVQVAAIIPASSPDSSVFSPEPVQAAPAPAPPPAARPSYSSVFSPEPVQATAVPPPRRSYSSVYTPAPVQAVRAAAMPVPPPVAPHPSFSIIPAAMADIPPPPPEQQYVPQGHVGWAIQVGAYSTSSNARAALGIAELSAVQMLVNGRPMVVSVYTAGRVKYRARVTGLPHDAAVNACDRLAGGPTGCEVLSPEGQS
jgi:Transglycosylase SLT domain/SPOR domain